MSPRSCLDAHLLVLDERAPLAAEAADALQPRLVELVAEVLVDERLARHAARFGQAHQLAFLADQLLVDAVQLLDEAFDAVVVERQALHVDDDLVAVLVVGLLLLLGALLAGDLLLELLVLLLAQLLVGRGDAVEGFENLRLQLGFHGGERQRVLVVVLVVHLAFGAVLAALFGLGLFRRLAVTQRGRRLLGLGAFVGGFEIDDVAEQNLAFVQLIAPDDDGLEGEGAFAQAGDHRLAAGLDALGDGDFALARQQLDRAHLAQVHADRIVGALGRLGARGGGGDGGRRGDGAAAAFFLVGLVGAGGLLGFLAFLGVDDVDAHVGQHRHRVFDLLGGHLLRRQHRVQLVIGDVAARLAGLQQLLDGLIGKVEQRAVALLRVRSLPVLVLGLGGGRRFAARSAGGGFRFQGLCFQGLVSRSISAKSARDNPSQPSRHR